MVEYQALETMKDIRPFLNLVKMRGHKYMFMILNDLWLYQYHQQDYDGIVRDTFKIISFIE